MIERKVIAVATFDPETGELTDLKPPSPQVPGSNAWLQPLTIVIRAQYFALGLVTGVVGAALLALAYYALARAE